MKYRLPKFWVFLDWEYILLLSPKKYIPIYQFISLWKYVIQLKPHVTHSCKVVCPQCGEILSIPYTNSSLLKPLSTGALGRLPGQTHHVLSIFFPGERHYAWPQAAGESERVWQVPGQCQAPGAPSGPPLPWALWCFWLLRCAYYLQYSGGHVSGSATTKGKHCRISDAPRCPWRSLRPARGTLSQCVSLSCRKLLTGGASGWRGC